MPSLEAKNFSTAQITLDSWTFWFNSAFCMLRSTRPLGSGTLALAAAARSLARCRAAEVVALCLRSAADSGGPPAGGALGPEGRGELRRGEGGGVGVGLESEEPSVGLK